MGSVSTNNAVKVTPSSAVTPGASSPAPSAPAQGGVEMATAMAAKLNAMLMAKGKLKAPQPLPSKVLISNTALRDVGCSHHMMHQGIFIINKSV